MGSQSKNDDLEVVIRFGGIPFHSILYSFQQGARADDVKG